VNGPKPYSAYKDSGIPWLGEVPEHWDIIPNRGIFEEIKEQSYSDEQMLSVTITQGVIKQKALLTDTSKKDSSNEDKSKYKLVCPGDIAYNKMRAWQGAVGVSKYRGIVSPAYIVVRPRGNQNSRYFHYLFRTPAFVKEAERWSYGISSDQWSLRPEEFKQIYISLPPISEQNAIIRYLDYMERRIRRYINAKKKLISLLNEQKQAIIHQAVTKGIDSNVNLKPSGVEWLGDIPENWWVIPLKFLSKRIQNGTTPPTSEPIYYEDGTIPWYGPSSCGKGNQVSRPVRYLNSLAFSIGKARLIRSPALLIIVIGASAGRMTLLSEDGSTNQQITAYELDTVRIHPTFVLHQLRGAEHWLHSTASTATIQILNAGEVARLPITVTSLLEQHNIVNNIERITTDISKTIESAEREIELLREYHTRLITDVVTGKLDVREAASNLPEELEEEVIEGIGELSEMQEIDMA
jgi:type I restriction enzyme S subunit